MTPMTSRKAPMVAAMVAMAAVLGGCTPAAQPVEQTTSASVDPLTCYIAGSTTGTAPENVTLTCGGGVTALVGITDAGAPAHDAPLGDWTISTTATGTSDIGSTIVRIFTTHADQECTYYRDMAEPARNTTVDCRKVQP
ncbi:hypothetical protein ANMWB30_23800 [Arthrobacter sp. MWB30]|nr:hypothetical protein ANMWB30_23800 [Arthrobacter sp. MWB30]